MSSIAIEVRFIGSSTFCRALASTLSCSVGVLPLKSDSSRPSDCSDSSAGPVPIRSSSPRFSRSVLIASRVSPAGTRARSNPFSSALSSCVDTPSVCAKRSSSRVSVNVSAMNPAIAAAPLTPNCTSFAPTSRSAPVQTSLVFLAPSSAASAMSSNESSAPSAALSNAVSISCAALRASARAFSRPLPSTSCLILIVCVSRTAMDQVFRSRDSCVSR